MSIFTLSKTALSPPRSPGRHRTATSSSQTNLVLALMCRQNMNIIYLRAVNFFSILLGRRVNQRRSLPRLLPGLGRSSAGVGCSRRRSVSSGSVRVFPVVLALQGETRSHASRRSGSESGRKRREVGEEEGGGGVERERERETERPRRVAANRC